MIVASQCSDFETRLSVLCNGNGLVLLETLVSWGGGICLKGSRPHAYNTLVYMYMEGKAWQEPLQEMYC